METKNREKILFIAVAVGVGLLVLNYLVYNPLAASWSSRQENIKSLRAQISEGVALKAHAASIEQHWNQMFTNTLPANPTLAESQLFKAFQGWAQSSRVVLVSQKPQQKDSDDPSYNNEEWHADVTGSINQIFNFLYSVESSPIGLKVDAVDLSTRDERGAQLALGLTVSGLILNPPTNNPVAKAP
jgi:hypothetical protein